MTENERSYLCWLYSTFLQHDRETFKIVGAMCGLGSFIFNIPLAIILGHQYPNFAIPIWLTYLASSFLATTYSVYWLTGDN